ncbi:unnamed protein product [Mytilus coruscus]|uniref:TRPM-like domain-containing protein n=1 Tax=Mytilus coruscus TaxID=42192 RepID=A0A6J8CTY4_MYTCO|nr:unnamed protein product [Mytilus coruscus]
MTGNGVDISEEMKGHDSLESSRMRTDVLQTNNGVDTSEEMDGDDSSDTESIASDIMDDREDLIACRECGLVFAHYRGLGNHNCRTKWILLPTSGEALEGILRGTSATVCCADDLPAYVSDRPKTFVVNTDNCNHEGTHWVAFHFPISGPPEFFDSLGEAPETYQKHFRNVLIVNGPRELTSEKTGLLKNKAPTLFGTIFTKSSFNNLEQRMKKIQENNHLITVYDIERADEITLEDTIVDAIIKGWSLKHIKDDQGDAIEKPHRLAPIMSEVLKDLCTNQVGDETQWTNVDYTIPEETYNTAFNTSLYISDLTPPRTPEPAIEIILKHDENETSIETDTNAENKLINNNETPRATDGTAEETSTSGDNKTADAGNLKHTFICISDEKSNELMEILQFSLEPGSLSLYFYIAYQYSQDPDRQKYKTKNTQILLLEAIIADRVDYVSAMLQHGIVFNTEHFEGLYDETFRCEDCKAKDCRSMHAIHHRCDNIICNSIWCTCLTNCKKCNKKASRNEHSKHCVRHAEHKNADGFKLKVDVCLQARYLCQKLLNFNQIDATDTKEEDKEQVYYDLLAWALLGNKVELATVFWSKCKNQLLTAIMASSILKSMASNVESTKDKKLYGELMEHSKLFENRVIEMQNTLYEKREIETMDLMEIEDEIFGMKVSPMVLAFENKMIDVIGHPCIQRRLNRIWYNFDPTDSPFSCSDGPNNFNLPASGAAAKWTDWIKNVCRLTESLWMEQALVSPLMVFAVHYLFVFAVIVWFSAFVLTDLDIIGSISDIGIYEWLLYIWLCADFCEEIIVPKQDGNTDVSFIEQGGDTDVSFNEPDGDTDVSYFHMYCLGHGHV